MTYNEAITEWFEKPMSEYIKSNPKELIEYLNNHRTKVAIADRNIGIEDVKKRISDPTYLRESFVSLTDDAITITTTNQDVIVFFVNNISKEVEELELPNYFLTDMTILSNFPNLKKLTIKGYCKASPEEIEYIKNNTQITEIISSNGCIVPYDYTPKKDEIYLTSPSPVLISGNLICRANSSSFLNNTVEGVISSDNIDFDLLKRAYESAIKSNERITRVTIKTTALTEESIYNRNLLDMEIDEDGNIDDLTYNGKLDPTKLGKIVQTLEKERQIKKINLRCKNKSYDKMYYLNPVAKKYNLKVDYGECIDCTLEEFTAMRETMDWFNSLVREENMSPAETLLAAYDIMKTFKYNENEEEKNQSRYIHNIVMTDYIVCVGYAKFLKQILTENNIPSSSVSVKCNQDDGTTAGHERTLVKLDDDKYNIHGVFCLDATWDSVTEKDPILVEETDGKKHVRVIPKETDKIEKTYDPVGLYRYFLVTPSEYETTYKNDTMPELLRIVSEHKLHNIIVPPERFQSNYPHVARAELEDLFGKTPDLIEVQRYMKTEKPSLETFRSILYNVRKSQGYTQEEASLSTDESIELNQMIDEYNNKTETFFQSKGK